MTSVLLVDDHEMVRAGLRIILGTEEDLDVVAEAVDDAAVVEAARVYKPDVVLMDIQMPGVDGIEATRRFVASMPGVRW
jgi:DNA-binding NarL/FixJ family response regulator